ncbi:MAG: hypothetical protein LBE38_01835 [Deltaproteobacteria bacterium]|jgi:hypothetical protein|nr:hypothetical protein [Deltaproteobacteria bacterium]
MSPTEERLKAIARELINMDEDELIDLLGIYHKRIDNYTTLAEWEEACVLYFVINGVRIRNIQFPEIVSQINDRLRRKGSKTLQVSKMDKPTSRPKPDLNLVK